MDFVPTARDLVQLASSNFTLARRADSDNNHAVNMQIKKLYKNCRYTTQKIFQRERH